MTAATETTATKLDLDSLVASQGARERARWTKGVNREQETRKSAASAWRKRRRVASGKQGLDSDLVPKIIPGQNVGQRGKMSSFESRPTTHKDQPLGETALPDSSPIPRDSQRQVCCEISPCFSPI